jgi:hypothetical protein
VTETTDTAETLKGLRLNIYRHVPYGDTSAQGVSSRADYVTLVGIVDTCAGRPRMTPLVGGSRGPFVPGDDAPAAVLVIRAIAGKLVYHVEPYHPEGYMFGRYMAGGSFVDGDSRFSELVGFYGAVSFHDRNESGR